MQPSHPLLAPRRAAAALLCCLSLSLSAPLAAQAQPAKPAAKPNPTAAAKPAAAAADDTDAYVARVLKTFDVPGIGLAIVKDGRVVLAKGYGVRKLGEPTPVDERTLFGIASNTKIFTATAL